MTADPLPAWDCDSFSIDKGQAREQRVRIYARWVEGVHEVLKNATGRGLLGFHSDPFQDPEQDEVGDMACGAVDEALHDLKLGTPPWMRR